MGRDVPHDTPRTTRAPGQRPVAGGTLTVLGRTLRFVGFAIGAGGGSGLANVFFSDPGPEVREIHWTLRVLIIVLVAGAGWLVFDVSRRMVVRGKQHRTAIITSFEQLRGERYILYLRPFALDTRMAEAPPEAPGFWTRSPFELPGLTTEEFLVNQFSRYGRVVAVGQPGEQLPLLGAQRGYLPLQGWQQTVSELIQGAHTVLMSVAPGPGTVWEYTEALRTIAPDRLVLMVACDPREYDTFRAAAASAYEARTREEGGSTWAPLPALPDCPVLPPASKREWAMPLRAFITFDQEWQPTVSRCVVTVPRLRHAWTVRRLVRTRLEPVLGPLAALPLKQPAHTIPLQAHGDSPDVPSEPASVLRQPLLGSVLVHQSAVTKRGRRTPGRRQRRK